MMGGGGVGPEEAAIATPSMTAKTLYMLGSRRGRVLLSMMFASESPWGERLIVLEQRLLPAHITVDCAAKSRQMSCVDASVAAAASLCSTSWSDAGC